VTLDHCMPCKYSYLLTLTLSVGRQEGHPACKKLGAGVVICLERGADLHMARRMQLPLTISCFGKIQIGFTFLVPYNPGSPGQRAVKRVCVCVCVTYLHSLRTCRCAGDLGAGERARVTWYVGHTAVSLARQPAAHRHIPPSPTSRRHHLPHQPQLRECRTTTWILDYRRIIPDLINYRNW